MWNRQRLGKIGKMVSSVCVMVTFVMMPIPSSMAQVSAVAPTGVGVDTVDSLNADSNVKESTAEIMAKIVSVDYKEVEVSSVLRSLAWAHKVNIVTSPDIKGKVTINLENVTLQAAIDAILKSCGLTQSVKDGVVFISQGDASAVEVSTDVIRLNYMKAAEAQNLCKKLISNKGDIKADEKSNSLIITDFQINIDKVQDLIDKVDVAPKQILIEAKIVDVTLTAGEDFGISWNDKYTSQHGGLFDRTTSIAESVDMGFRLPSSPASGSSGSPLTFNKITLRDQEISVRLNSLIKDKKAVVLASPSIAVLNGQEARIVIGERYPYKERTQTTSGTTETTKFVDIGTLLRVTPLINDDGYITLNIHPEVSSLMNPSSVGSDGPQINTREADTTVRVKAGETIVIGGLTKQNKDRANETVPVLGKIPVIGFLFSQKNNSDQQQELSVFITTKILWSEEEKRMRGYKKEDNNVLVEETGELALVETLFSKAVNLDRGKGLESLKMDKDVRKRQALVQYEVIYTQFSDTLRAPEAMYLAANIHRNQFKDFKTARKLYLKVASNYAKTPFASLAKMSYQEIEGQS